MAVQIAVDAQQLAELCQRHHVQRLALFGSVLRDDFGPKSDIDVLVEFQPGYVPGFGFIDLQDELSQVLRGKVDLSTPGFLSPYIRDRIHSEARVLYDAD